MCSSHIKPVAVSYESRFVTDIEFHSFYSFIGCRVLHYPSHWSRSSNGIKIDPPHSSSTGLPLSVALPACLGITTGTTANDLINGVCKKLTLISARGTFEEGNIGSLVGPPVVDALVSMLGEAQVAVQGVSHNPADPQDYLFGEGSVTGSRDFAALITQAMT